MHNLLHFPLKIYSHLSFDKLDFPKNKPTWRQPVGRLEMTCAPTVASSCDYTSCRSFCLCTLLLLCIFLFSVLPPLPLFSGQISLAPWGQMRRPSWLMCRVTTTRSQASRRWEMKRKKKENPQTITGYLPKWLAENDRVVSASNHFFGCLPVIP